MRFGPGQRLQHGVDREARADAAFIGAGRGEERDVRRCRQLRAGPYRMRRRFQIRKGEFAEPAHIDRVISAAVTGGFDHIEAEIGERFPNRLPAEDQNAPGALVFEMLTKRGLGPALKASLGVFLGTVFNFVLRFALAAGMAYVFVVELWRVLPSLAP